MRSMSGWTGGTLFVAVHGSDLQESPDRSAPNVFGPDTRATVR